MKILTAIGVILLLSGTGLAFMNQEVSISGDSSFTNTSWMKGYNAYIDGKVFGDKYLGMTFVGRITEVQEGAFKVEYTKYLYYDYENWYSFNRIQKEAVLNTGFVWVPCSWLDSGKVIIQ